MFVPNGESTLLPGAYNFNTDYAPFTILAEDSEVEYAGATADITGGSIMVHQDGADYTVVFNLMTEAGDLTGECTLPLAWFDESESGGGSGTLVGVVSVGSQNFAADHGEMIYYGQSYPGEGANIDLRVYAENNGELYLEMFVPETETELVENTYVLDGGTRLPFTILRGSVENGVGGYAEFTGGTVDIAKSGETYTITFNLTSDAVPVTGTVTGTLEGGGGGPVVPGGSSVEGNIMAGSDNFAAAKGQMLYFGQFEPDEGANVDLGIFNVDETYGVSLEMFVPETDMELAEGLYTFTDDYQPFTFDYGAVRVDNVEYEIRGGTVDIARSGDNFTITFDLTSDVGDVTGTVTGTLDWEDYTGSRTAGVKGMKVKSLKIAKSVRK